MILWRGYYGRVFAVRHRQHEGILGRPPLSYRDSGDFNAKIRAHFFQELDKMPDYPRTNHELQVLRGIKDQKIFFIILVIYFFAMGTVTLCYE